MTVVGVRDLIARGTKDDGSVDGVVLVKSLGSGLVRVPIKLGEVTTEVSTAGTCGATNGVGNSDGTGLAISLAAPQVSGATTSSAVVETTIWGPRIGVRFTRGTATAPFSLVVDGVAYKVDATRNRRHAASTFTVSDSEAMFVIADDLGPGPHNVQVVVVGKPANGDGVTRSIGLLGFVADSAYYSAQPRASVSASTPVAVPTSATQIPVVSQLGFITAIDFFNTNAATRTISLLKGDVVYFTSAAIALSVGTYRFEFPKPIQSIAAVQSEKWLASGAGVVARIYEEV